MGFRINLINRAKGAWSATKIVAQKHGPKIAIGVGVGLLLTGTVIAVIEAQKIPEILEEKDKELEKIHEDIDSGIVTEEEAGAETLQVYKRCLWKFVQLFGKVVVIEGVGLFFIAKGVTKLSSALAGVNTLLLAQIKKNEEMEERIREEFGEDVLNRLKYGDAVEITHIESEENGGTVTVTKVFGDEGDGNFDFIIRVGEMGDFSATSETLNRMLINEIVQGINLTAMTYGFGIRYNDFLGKFDKKHPKITLANEVAMLGFPVIKGRDNRIRYEADELDGTDDPANGKTARDIRFRLLTRPVPMGEILEDEGYLARCASSDGSMD